MEDRFLSRGNEIISTQVKLNDIAQQKKEITKENVVSSIKERHGEAGKIIRESLNTIVKNDLEKNDDDFNEINNSLNDII